MDKLDHIDQRALLLKRGTRLLAKACGGQEAAGDICGRSGETVRRWGDPNVPETIPVYMIALLEAECGQPLLTRMLAEMSGHALKPLKGEPVEGCIVTAHAEASLANAELHMTVLEAKRDGVITPNEAEKIGRAGVRAQAAVGKLLSATKAGRVQRPGQADPAPAEAAPAAPASLSVVKGTA